MMARGAGHGLDPSFIGNDYLWRHELLARVKCITTIVHGDQGQPVPALLPYGLMVVKVRSDFVMIRIG